MTRLKKTVVGLTATLLVATGSAPAGAQDPPALRGWVDMHTHPMSYLGFGKKAIHGAPDIGSILPAGTRDCNAHDELATSIDEALGHCNSTHGGWGGFGSNECGDHIRAAIITNALDNEMHDEFKVFNFHGDHIHAGYPSFPFWPHQSSKLHQQMWWEWLHRSYQGGLRVMVALAVNSVPLAELLGDDPVNNDKAVADLQIDETIKLVNRHNDFMEIAYSSDDLRRIVGQNKLAVLLGVEVDQLGDFGRPGVDASESAVRSEIRRLYSKGVRYFFPIHLVDNSFGGAAVYEPFFNFANKHINGSFYSVTTSADPDVQHDATDMDVPGWLGAIEPLLPLLASIGGPRAQLALEMFDTDELVAAYAGIPPEHVNSLGLLPLGAVAIDEMMKLGALIDLDHMSQKSMTNAIELAELAPGGYPLVMGHNGIRKSAGPDGRTERHAPRELVVRLNALGGMFGVGTANTTPADLIDAYEEVANVMRDGAVAVGTDVNGFERLPRHSRPEVDLEGRSDRFYSRFFADPENGLTARSSTGDRTWDYILDGGVSHYGLMPELLYDVKTHSESCADDDDCDADGRDDNNVCLTRGCLVYDELMTSAEGFAKMWQKAEQVGSALRPAAAVAAIARSPDGKRLDVWAAGKDNNVCTAFYSDNGVPWNGWHQIAGPMPGGLPWGAPITVLSRFPDGHGVDVWATGKDGNVYTAFYNDAGVPWEGWNQVAGPVPSGLPRGAPVTALARYPDGSGLDVWVTGNDGNVYTAFYNDNGTPWEGWNQVAGAVPSGLPPGAPVTALARYPDGSGLDIWVTGNDGNVYTAFYNDYGVPWNGWHQVVGAVPSGLPPGAPVTALARFPDGSGLDIWVTGNDGNVYTAYYNDYGVPWNGWHEVVGLVPSGLPPGAPVAALARFPDGSGIDIWVTGVNGVVYTAYYNDYGVPWNGWHEVVGPVPGGLPAGAPVTALARFPDGHGLDIWVTGTDGNVYTAYYNDNGVPWSGWHQVAGALRTGTCGSGYTLTTIVPAEPLAGGLVSVTWSAPEGHAGSDWVGLYRAGDASSQPVAFVYVGDLATTGQVSLELPNEIGSFYFRYFVANSDVVGAVSPSFQTH